MTIIYWNTNALVIYGRPAIRYTKKERLEIGGKGDETKSSFEVKVYDISCGRLERVMSL